MYGLCIRRKANQWWYFTKCLHIPRDFLLSGKVSYRGGNERYLLICSYLNEERIMRKMFTNLNKSGPKTISTNLFTREDNLINDTMHHQ